MINRMFLVLALVAGLGLAAAAPAAFADRTAELTFEDGLLLDPGQAGAAPGIAAQWKNRLGADRVRIQAYWNALSPAGTSPTKPAGFNVADPNSPGYQWGNLDRAVNTAKGAGLKIMITIHQCGPRWASSQPSKATACWKPKAALYGQFATAVAKRYRSSVDIWLLENEGNEKVFLAPQTECKGSGRKRVCERTAANLSRDYINAAYPAVKRADPGSKVIIGELAPIGAVGKTAGNLAPLAFIRALWCLDDKYKRIRTGACKKFKAPKGDGFGYHPYQVKERPNQPQRNPNLAKLGDLKRLFGVLDKVSHRRFNLYITEYGYETNPPDRRNGVSPALQSKYLQQAAYIAWSTPRVKMFSQFQWRDDAALSGFQTGLHFNNDSAKPSFNSFPHPFFVDTSKGRGRAVIWGQVRPNGVRSVQVLQQKGRSAFKRLLTANLDRLGYFSARRSLPRNSSYKFTYSQGGTTVTSDTFHVS
jgi:Cellulase (glycosyl hydrolase family 5)